MSLTSPKGVRYSPKTLAQIEDLRVIWSGPANQISVADVIRYAIARAHELEVKKINRKNLSAGR